MARLVFMVATSFFAGFSTALLLMAINGPEKPSATLILSIGLLSVSTAINVVVVRRKMT